MERILAAELSAHVDQRVRLAGWLQHQRQLAQVAFVLLRDRSGIAQVVLTERATRDYVAALLGETVVEIEGTVVANEQAPSGVEVVDAIVEVLTEPTEAPPFELVASMRVSQRGKVAYLAKQEGWQLLVDGSTVAISQEIAHQTLCFAGEEPRFAARDGAVWSAGGPELDAIDGLICSGDRWAYTGRIGDRAVVFDGEPFLPGQRVETNTGD